MPSAKSRITGSGRGTGLPFPSISIGPEAPSTLFAEMKRLPVLAGERVRGDPEPGDQPGHVLRLRVVRAGADRIGRPDVPRQVPGLPHWFRTGG